MTVDDVIELFASVTEVSKPDMVPDMVVADAGIASLDILRFIVQLEADHGIEIEGEQIETIANGTFRDVAKAIGWDAPSAAMA